MKQKINLLSLLLASSLVSSAYCADYIADCNRERMCPTNPLYCDGFNLQFHAGVTPIIWANRGCMSFLTTTTSITSCASTHCSTASTNCSTPCASAVSISSLNCSDACGTSIAQIKIPKFNKMFETPWTIGATLGYAVTENHEVFTEFNYTQAANKEFFTTNVTNATAALVLLQTNLLAKYKNASVYFGYRYNFDRGNCICSNVSWFLDLKAGFIHHYSINGFINSSLTTSALTGSTTPLFNIFKSSTAFSGAGEVGVDICLNADWSLLIGAEIAAAWGPTCHSVSIPVTELANNAINTAKIGAEILFPITFGLRYKF